MFQQQYSVAVTIKVSMPLAINSTLVGGILRDFRNLLPLLYDDLENKNDRRGYCRI